LLHDGQPRVSVSRAICAGLLKTRVFKLERLILKMAASKPSMDDEAKQLAAGSVNILAAWYEEARDENQLLMSDFHHRTRSWLFRDEQA
jgi:hypothetical protein